MENIIIRIRCDACGSELNQMRAMVEPLTGVLTIMVGKCKPCLDEQRDAGYGDCMADYDIVEDYNDD